MMNTVSLPDKMHIWRLYGSGLESLQLEEAGLPTPGPEELLVKQDACGLCYSDTKVIGLGTGHPRMAGRDLKTDPATLGHEVACTVAAVGESLQERFKPGDRFVVQADVFYKGVSMAYGYAIRGGLAEYSIIPKQMIDGDEGCYLLPIAPDTGYVAAALTEPWACVVYSYLYKPRGGIKPGGDMLIVAGEEEAHLEGLFEQGKPGQVTIMPVGGAHTEPIRAQLRAAGVAFQETMAGGWALLHEKHAGGFDDILVTGGVPAEKIEAASALMADGAILNISLPRPLSRSLSLDVGRIHYNGRYVTGTASGRLADSYSSPRTADLQPGGQVWFIGAGGPMGQMHVQRALQLPEPPRLVVATDRHDHRMAGLSERFQPLADERGIKLVLLNVRDMPAAQLQAKMRELSGEGFSDIVSMVASTDALEEAAGLLAPNGWFNIFAGVPRGTMASLDVNRIVQEGCRYIGSSGSSLAAMRETLHQMESGKLNTNASLAAIGGMEAAKEGLDAVKTGRFSGKALIFPSLEGLPLITLPELKEKMPKVFALLDRGLFWTKEAEEEFLKEMQGGSN